MSTGRAGDQVTPDLMSGIFCVCEGEDELHGISDEGSKDPTRQVTAASGQADDVIEDGDEDESEERFRQVQSSTECVKFTANIQEMHAAWSSHSRHPCWSHEQWVAAREGMKHGYAASDTSDVSSEASHDVELYGLVEQAQLEFDAGSDSFGEQALFAAGGDSVRLSLLGGDSRI
ncbi:unnamed protein product [Polarella glacialis]|uniref:Uncharacterized protein n=1 Tax=Polarella glacialis TaxID=89957 RepID=A0A813LJM0_POLGL|nr:unnamed protein product [Polarella glacialis]|mmetsp:Transcript_35962/g.64998  ORF Transcript_35962/g.64998 Transcript_35962/m.64998 type:complete len:175 (-) Transcript_35962:162-686(-)|eukprot:CAMPEP_0115068606 /NCGR_PEP_ID=MMETSP0227-20121206/12071_1 /TAXON_ID=89957 /ORGANISM="Polarella glacialis, Strain CCMP 1383" /LENGTH=174 /DNA_ID=CAMNT_0002454867 /DNA_START=52 /DNA_END=576 /DNA_ORIENTATION=+